MEQDANETKDQLRESEKAGLQASQAEALSLILTLTTSVLWTEAVVSPIELNTATGRRLRQVFRSRRQNVLGCKRKWRD